MVKYELIKFKTHRMKQSHDWSNSLGRFTFGATFDLVTVGGRNGLA
jgi:hypothetical protein